MSPVPSRVGATRARRLTLVHAALAAFAVLAIGMMLTWPLGYDQGVFASVGDTVARGGAPYRDAWDIKGPFEFYAMAAIELVFGRHAWGLRVVDVAIALATAEMLRRRLRHLIPAGAAVTAALLWPTIVASLNFQNAAQFDLWIGSAMLAVTLLVTRPGGYRARDLAVAGSLIGLATIIKPIFPVFLAVPGVVILLRRSGAIRAIAGDLAALLLGWIVPIAGALAGLALQGALQEAWNVSILYNLRVYGPNVRASLTQGSSPTAMRAIGLVTYLADAKVAIVVAPAVAGAVVLWRTQRVLAAAVLTWLGSGIALVVLQNKFWPYHWETVYAGAFLLVTIGVVAIVREARASNSPATRSVGVVTAVAAIALWSGPAAIELRRWLMTVSGLRSTAWYEHTLTQYSELNPGDAIAAAAYIQAHTPPGAPFAQWTLHGDLAFLAGRPHVTRFHNKRELMRSLDRPITQAYRAEYLDHVRRLRPAYIAVDKLGEHADSAAAPKGPAEVLATQFPELSTLVAERYALAARFGDIDVFRLKAPTGAGHGGSAGLALARPK